MRRRLLLASLVVGAAIGLTGCSATGTQAPVPMSLAAPPQTAQLDWVEPFPATAPALVFGVRSFKVTDTGWSADISVENRSSIGWQLVARHHEDELRFGLMLLPNGDLDELERLNKNLDLPTLRPATSYDPQLPVVLKAGATWRGTIAAPGALAGGRWVRFSFGPFTSVGEPPKGVPATVVWFTDHAYRLEEVSAVPA